jgi:hypothetical protein
MSAVRLTTPTLGLACIDACQAIDLIPMCIGNQVDNMRGRLALNGTDLHAWIAVLHNPLEGSWVHINQDCPGAANYTYWANNQPTKEVDTWCALMNYTSGEWHTRKCTRELPCMCSSSGSVSAEGQRAAEEQRGYLRSISRRLLACYLVFSTLISLCPVALFAVWRTCKRAKLWAVQTRSNAAPSQNGLGKEHVTGDRSKLSAMIDIAEAMRWRVLISLLQLGICFVSFGFAPLLIGAISDRFPSVYLTLVGSNKPYGWRLPGMPLGWETAYRSM